MRHHIEFTWRQVAPSERTGGPLLSPLTLESESLPNAGRLTRHISMCMSPLFSPTPSPAQQLTTHSLSRNSSLGCGACLRNKDNSREITVMGNDNSSLDCDGGWRTRAAGVMGLLYENSSLGCDGDNSREITEVGKVLRMQARVAVLGHKTRFPGKLSTSHTGQGPAGEEIRNPGWFNGLVGHQKPAKQQTHVLTKHCPQPSKGGQIFDV